MYELSKSTSEIRKKLYKKIIEIDKNDNDFITGAMTYTNEDDIKMILGYIESGEYINKNSLGLSKTNISVFSLILHNRREGIMPKETNPYDYVPVEPLEHRRNI